MTNEEFKKAEEQIFGTIKAQLGDKVPTEDEFIAAANRSSNSGSSNSNSSGCNTFWGTGLALGLPGLAWLLRRKSR